MKALPLLAKPTAQLAYARSTQPKLLDNFTGRRT